MLVENNNKAHCLSLYISELSLLYAEFGSYPLGKLAAACVLLARLMLYTGKVGFYLSIAYNHDGCDTAQFHVLHGVHHYILQVQTTYTPLEVWCM